MASEYITLVEGVESSIQRKTTGKKTPTVQYTTQRKTFNNTTPHQLAQEGKLEELKLMAEMLNLTLKGIDDNGRTLLHVSTIANQCEMMKYLISCGNDLNAVDNNGDTALHLAVSNRHIEAAKTLLSHGADDTILNKQSDAPLHIAARKDHGAMVATMLEYPIIMAVKGLRKHTPMHVVAENDSIEVLKVFHNYVAKDKNNNKCFRLCDKDEDEVTPIHLAARKGSHRVLECMMDWGRDHGYTVDQVLGFLDEENNTPLHTAVDGGHEEVVRVFLTYGASPTESKINQLPPIHLACSQGKLKMVELMVQFGGIDVIACRDVFGQTPLHSSTLPPSTLVLSYLINIGAQLNVCNNQGQTPLITATLSGNLDAVKLLLKSGADPLVGDQKEGNPLHYAILRNRKAIAKCLLDHTMAPRMLIETNHSGSSPVHCALQQGLSDLVSKMLTLLEGSHEHRDHQSCNYLHLAALGGDWKTVNAILDIPTCHTFLNEVNKIGSTPLHLATAGGHLHCVEILLSHGAMTHKCSCGFTPFMVACRMGHAECAKVLFEAHPFQKNWSNDEGNTALHLAALARSPACVSLALDIGVPLTYNHNQESFFTIILENVDSESALAVIQHDRWSECLKFKSPLHPHPMVGLVAKLPEVAKSVLDRCCTKSLLPRDHLDYWESYNFEHLKTDAVNQVSTSKHIEENSSVDLNLSMAISGTQHTSSMTISTPLEEKPYSILNKMAELRREALLNHVVVNAYIKQKWQAYGHLIFMISLTLSFMKVLLLSIFVKETFPYSQNVTQNVTTSNYLSAGSVAIAIIALLFNTIRAIWLFLYLINYGYRVLNINKNLPLWIGGASVITSYMFLLSAIIRGYDGVIWTAGALAVFFGWFGLALELSLFDLFGIYVVMFLHITRTLFLVLTLCLPFLFAFGLAFYILASGDPNFSTIDYSLVTAFSYVLGQMNYGQFILDENTGALSNATLVFLLAILVAIILAIAFNNLLVGLAVGDIEQIRHTALVHRQASRISTLIHLEKVMPQYLKQKFNPIDWKVYPNKKVPFLQLMWRHFWRAIKNENLEDEGGTPEETVEQDSGARRCEERLLQLKQQVEEMTARQEKMLELIQHLHQSRMESTAVELYT